MTASTWEKLLSDYRRKKGNDQPSGEPRSAFERDYDRILFSAPVRRLADKTQVFPLDSIDTIRTRLT
ncbi:MAG: deoxyguanosinetriphosphate triphosphohydrolase, partial [Myxococcota bacterium]